MQPHDLLGLGRVPFAHRLENAPVILDQLVELPRLYRQTADPVHMLLGIRDEGPDSVAARQAAVKRVHAFVALEEQVGVVLEYGELLLLDGLPYAQQDAAVRPLGRLGNDRQLQLFANELGGPDRVKRIGATTTPARDRRSTSPSALSRDRASRTGVRLTPRSPASACSPIASFGFSSSPMILRESVR